MKKHYLKSLSIITFLAIICQISIAQTHSYNTTTIVATAPYDYFSDFEIYITNLQPNDSLSITWERISNTLPSAWDHSICDFGNCFVGVPNGNTMNKMPPGATEYFKLSLNPENNAGQGLVKLLVYETGNMANSDTLTFDISTANANTSIVGVTVGTNGKFTVPGNLLANFPNSSGFSVVGSTGNNGSYSVVSSMLVGNNTEITVANIPDATVDGTIIYAITGIGVDAELENQITIFPNPVKDHLNVKLDPYSSINSVAIYNVIGKKLMDVSVYKNAINKISLNKIPTGVYFIQYVNENGTPVTQKFFKTN